MLTPIELDDGTAYLMMLNPTGGLVGGDSLVTHAALEADTRVCLTTPSATRVYRTLGEPAVQETHIQVGEDASLEFLPEHVIPQRDSSLRQLLRVDMGLRSRGIFWDALAAGRVAHGERWNFREVDSRVEISLCGQTVYLPTAPGSARKISTPDDWVSTDGFNYMATLIVVADESDSWQEIVMIMAAELNNVPEVSGGASALAYGGCVVKLLARSASDLLQAQMMLWKRARQAVFGLTPIELRKY